MAAEHLCEYCHGWGERPTVTVESITEHMAKVTPGEWRVDYESADLEYSTNPPYPHAITGPENDSVTRSTMSAEYKEQYKNQISEIVEMTDADAELVAHSPEYIRFLLSEVERLSK